MSPSHRLHGSHSRRRSIGPTCRLRTGRTPGLALLLALLVPGPGWGAEPQDGQVADSQVVDTAAVDTLEPDTLPPPEQISQERSATDEEIRNALQALFDRVPSLRGIRVGVEAGVVHLEGRVLDSETQTRAGELASAQEGVLWVENDIALDTSLSRRLEPTWDRLQDLVFGFLARLPLLVVGLLIVLFSLWLGGRLGRWGGPSWIRFKNPFLQNIVGRAIQAVVVLAGLLLALDLMEATALVGAVAGTAGLAGLAVGFAFQDIVQNYLAGLLMAVRQPFDKNDHVLVDSYEGKIVRLTPRETILMTLDGNHVRVPNALVFRSPMTNFTRNPRRRFQFDAGVGPGDDLALARRGGIEVMEEMEGILSDPAPEAVVVALGDSSVTVRFMAWVDQRTADFGRVRSEAIRLVKRRLEATGVSLPSPEFIIRMAGAAEAETPGGEAVPETPKPPAQDFELSDVRGEQEDVSPDDAVDRQIQEDRERSGERNLLEADGGDGAPPG